nr:MAG TPA: hypothetical protein [Bacteriophage sp.]
MKFNNVHPHFLIIILGERVRYKINQYDRTCIQRSE